MRRIWIGACAAVCVLVGSVQAAEWRIPGLGEMTLPAGTEVEVGMPASAPERNLNARLHRHGIYGSEYYLLRGQREADFAYAWAARIPLDAAFVRTQRVAVPSSRADAVQAAGQQRLPMLTVKRTRREVPAEGAERLARAAALAEQLCGPQAQWLQPFAKTDADGSVLYGSWMRPWREHGVRMDQYYQAWLIDRGTTVEMFWLVTDGQHPAWTKALTQAWQSRKESRGRYFSK